MENYGVLFDGIFGDISISEYAGTIDLDVEESKTEYTKNLIRTRLKSLDGNYGREYRYNLFKNIGTRNGRELESVMKNTVTNMLTYDGFINKGKLEVLAMSAGHKMTIGIKVSGLSDIDRSFLEMIITRMENGKSLWASMDYNKSQH